MTHPEAGRTGTPDHTPEHAPDHALEHGAAETAELGSGVPSAGDPVAGPVPAEPVAVEPAHEDVPAAEAPEAPEAEPVVAANADAPAPLEPATAPPDAGAAAEAELPEVAAAPTQALDLAEPVPAEPAVVEPVTVAAAHVPPSAVDAPAADAPAADAPAADIAPVEARDDVPHTPSGSVAASATAGAATAASALADPHAHEQAHEHLAADPDAGPGRRLGLPVVLTAVLALLLLAAVAYLGWSLRQQQLTETARSQATAASREAARLLFSYDHAKLDEDFAKGLATTTGTFTEEYARTTKEVVAPVAKEYKAVVVADVVESAVIRAEPDQVTTLVFLNQATTSTRVTGQQVDQSRVRMTLVKRGDRWLVSAVKAL